MDEVKVLYKDACQPIEARVEDLLSRMTLEEKVAQLCGDLASSFIVDGKISHDALKEKFKDGHGRFTQYSLVGLVDSEQIAKITNEIQDFFVNETRLGIPVALQSENLCGYPGEGGTLFPSQMNVGMTWEPELAKEMSSIIGQESRAVGITSAMSPVIDVSRDPRWGRTYETYGEDYYLISQMGINYIKGMQEQGVSCIAKHFLGYAETQAGLNTATTRLNDRELYEVFATPFEAADKEAGLDAMMANYAEIDGLPVIDNKKIIGELLRDVMGFKGALTSDGAAVLKTFNYYKVANSYNEAGYLAKKAGTDTEIPVGAAFKNLPEYVKNGMLDEKIIDESVRRILTIKFKRGLFENPYCEIEKVKGSMVNKEKEEVSKKIAQHSVVLLKNDGILPVKKGTKVAVIGPHGDSLRYPVSGYTYPAYIEMMDASRKDAGSISFNGIADEEAKLKEESAPKGPFATMYEMLSNEDVAALDDMNAVLRKLNAASLKEAMEKRFEVRYSKGCDIIEKDESGFDEAVKTANDSDVVVMALGGNCGWVNVTGGEGKDRQSLNLPGVQQKLLEKVCSTGKPVVLVLYGPGVFAVNWANENVSGIIQAGMPGQFAGEVVTNVIDGSYNPGGKLTMSIPRSTGQIPIFYNHKTGSGYASGGDETASVIFSGGYTDGEATPLYPFGYGLSYTDFELSDFKVDKDEVDCGGEIVVSCEIKNTGEVPGDEVVQLYQAFHGAHVVRPNKQLCAFKRVRLEPKQQKKIKFTLKMSQLGYYNENMDFVVEPGVLDIMIGTSSDNLDMKKEINVVGKTVNIQGKRTYICKSEII